MGLCLVVKKQAKPLKGQWGKGKLLGFQEPRFMVTGISACFGKTFLHYLRKNRS